MKDIKIPVETYQRVVGYYRPRSQTNPGKKEEIEGRNQFMEDDLEKAIKKNKDKG